MEKNERAQRSTAKQGDKRREMNDEEMSNNTSVV